MAEPLTTQSVEDVETKLNEAVNSIENPDLKQAMQNIKDLIWSQKDVINDMDEIKQDDFENFAQNLKTIENNEVGISLVANLLNAGFKKENEFNSYWDSNFDEISKLKKFNLCLLRFYGKYVENENLDKNFFFNFVIGAEKENYAFIAHPMMRESTSHFVTQDETSWLNKEKQNALFFSYEALYHIFLLDEKYKNEPEYIPTVFISLLSHTKPYYLVLTKGRFNEFFYKKIIEDNKNFDDFMDMWFKAKGNSEIDFENLNFVCELMQDWERVYQNVKLIRFMKLFVNNIESTEKIEKFFLNSFDELLKIMSFNDLSFTNMEGCRNSLNKKIDDSSFENGKTIKELLDRYIFRSRFSRFFKKAFEDEEFLNFILEKEENFKALLECYNENPRLFYNRDITWETKAKVTLIKEGKFFRDDTALNIPLKKDEVDRSSVMVRMDKRPELEGDEIVILFELSSRSWWWNRSLCLNLNKESFTKLAKIMEKVPNQKEFLDWIYSNRKKLIVKNRGENSNTLVTNFEELAQNAGFFILSENQKKVFDRIPEENREEFKNNFTQCPEFRATVEILGKTITDTESFIKLYSSFFWAYNLLSLNIQLSCAMQLVMGNVMENFLSVQKTEDVKFINETLNNLKPNLKHDVVPQIESQLSER